MNSDYTFAIFCWFLVLTPLVVAIANANAWWLLLYVPVALIFGMA